MSLILNLETSTKTCSVALALNGNLLAVKESAEGMNHAEKLTLFIEEVLKRAGCKITDPDAIAVSKGPGSYTGLRIGVSTAKGLCVALEKPLLSVNSLLSLASQATQQMSPGLMSSSVLLCPMIDARRMEVYCAVFDESFQEIRSTAAEIITPASFGDLLQKNKIIFFGDGAGKCKDMLGSHPHAVFVENISASASGMTQFSYRAFEQKLFEPVADFEPYYLKDFVGTTPKVQV